MKLLLVAAKFIFAQARQLQLSVLFQQIHNVCSYYLTLFSIQYVNAIPIWESDQYKLSIDSKFTVDWPSRLISVSTVCVSVGRLCGCCSVYMSSSFIMFESTKCIGVVHLVHPLVEASGVTLRVNVMAVPFPLLLHTQPSQPGLQE